jgi:peptidoglycan hydrolase CwlO-like protein
LTNCDIVNKRAKNKNSQMKKNKKPHLHRYIRSGVMATILSVLILGFGFSPVATAVNYQAQINNLSNQNTQAQTAIKGLQNQATNYQQAIVAYQDQIAGIQNSIAINQTKSAVDQQQIISDNAKIAQNKTYLANDLKTMYVQGQMSTIEQLATSQNLSTFVNKQEDNIKIQDRLDGLLTTIKNLQLQAQNNKNQISILLNIEQAQQAQLTADQNQQNQLLAMNQQQQSSYTAQLAANNSKIAALVAEQIAANRLLVSVGHTHVSGSCGGTYPLTAQGPYGPWGCSYVHSSDFLPGCTYMDSWGMCNRECVSYTAWMVYHNYNIAVTGFGDANQWPGNAQAAGIPTGSTPKAGSVAIYMGGSGDPWGHAMWVQSVHSNGTITVEQYNKYYTGTFLEDTISSSGLTYIYFGSS